MITSDKRLTQAELSAELANAFLDFARYAQFHKPGNPATLVTSAEEYANEFATKFERQARTADGTVNLGRVGR